MEYQKPQPTPYMRMDTDRYFFAAYLNSARHNAFITINDYLKKVGKEKKDGKVSYEINDDEFIVQALDILASESKPEESLKLISHLQKRFSFAESMMDSFLFQKNKTQKPRQEKPLPIDYYHFFQELFQTLNNLRNEFTHPFHAVTPISDTIKFALNNTFDAAARKVKDRFGWEQSTVEHLCRMTQGMVEHTDKFGRVSKKKEALKN